MVMFHIITVLIPPSWDTKVLNSEKNKGWGQKGATVYTAGYYGTRWSTTDTVFKVIS